VVTKEALDRRVSPPDMKRIGA